MTKQLLTLLCICAFSSTFAQVNVTGKVTDGSTGEGLPGVSILVVGQLTGATTDIDGNYKLNAKADDVLRFSFIGYSTVEETVGNRTTIDLTLELDATQLNEVVVTAFGLEKDKKSLGYSVTQVGGEEFTESRAINLGNALTGKIAGVNVSSPSSGAAGSSRVVIRGGSSLTGNDQPLYVVNGIPMDNTTAGSAGLWGGNDGGDGLSSINPDDIESISVLKGNAAAALYGSRASNGVVLITTKSGKAQQGIGVSFNSNFTFDQVYDQTDFQKEYGYGNNGEKPTNQASALENGNSHWGARLDGSDVVQFDGVARPYSDLGQGIGDFFRTGRTWTNTIALSGGNESHTYRFSASKLTNEDIMPNSGFDKDQFSANINGKYGKLTAKVTGQYSKETAQNRPRLSDTPGNANFTVLMKNPAISFDDLQGDPNKLGADVDGTELQHQGNVFAQNPYWAAYQFSREDVRDRFLGNALLKYDITDWLYVQGRVGTDFWSRTEEAIEPYGTAFKGLGGINTTTRRVREDNMDFFVGVNKTFGDISLDLLLGANRMRRTDESVRVGGNDLNIPFFHSVTNVRNQTYTYNFSELGINSGFTNANIGFKNFLFLNLSVRKDNFSTLSRDDNSLLYSSAGLSFVLSDIVELPAAVSLLKLRAAWGEVGGNGGLDPYKLAQTYSLEGNGHLGAVVGRITDRGNIPNSTIKPFVSSEYEFGFDARFLDNRLGIDFAYYSRTTTDEIVNTTVSSASGFNTTTINVGELTNSGIELLINATPVRTADFTWDVSLNLASNQSNVVSLGVNAEGDPIESLDLDEARTRQERIRNVVGQPVGVIAGFKHRTIDGQPVYTADGFPVRSEGFEILGEGRHPLSAGLNNNFTYKNFTMGILIDMRSGGSVMSGTNVLAYGFGAHKETLVGREDGITVTGVDTDGSPLTVNIAPENVDEYYGEYNNITDNFVYDASFGKLRQFSLGFNFPKSMLDSTPLNTASLSFVARNLLVLWSNVPNIDPESGYTNSARAQGLEYFALPATRNFGFNLSITF